MRGRWTKGSAPTRWIQSFRRSLILWLVVGWAGLWGSGASAQGEGHKQTDKLIQRIEKTIEEMAETRKQLKKSLDAYASMLQEQVDDRRSAYRDLVKAIDRSEKESKEAQKRAKEMDKEAKKFFKEWSKSVKAIKSKDLRKRSEARLDKTRNRYSKMLEARQQVDHHFESVITSLRDQLVYVEHDLNRSAAASLKRDQVTLNQMAANLFEEMDEFMNIANEYIRPLRPE